MAAEWLAASLQLRVLDSLHRLVDVSEAALRGPERPSGIGVSSLSEVAAWVGPKVHHCMLDLSQDEEHQ